MPQKRSILDIEDDELNPIPPIGTVFGNFVVHSTRINENASYADSHSVGASVTFAMLISESVYKLVLLVERSIPLFNKFVLKPCSLLLR